MKSLVTGGCGFIGSHLVDRLVDDGHEVIVIDNLSAESNEKFYYNDRAEYHHTSVADYESISPLFEGVDYVFHLAAVSRIQLTIDKPLKASNDNFMGTCNVLEASRQHDVKRVVYSSTSSAYGLKNTPPLKEDMPRDCLNPYSVTKVAAEDLCKMYNNLYGVNTVVFRYFNVYGERQPLKGQYAPVVGIFLRQKAGDEKMTIVGDGLQTRDFTHVKDVVNANVRAATTDNQTALGEVINVGTGENCSVLDIARMIGGDYEFIPPRPGEARSTLADTTKIKELLGFKPEIKLEDWINNILNN
jgi:UDP-glucose 4-epimerase